MQSATRAGLLVQYHHLQGFIPTSQFGPKITPDTVESLIGYDIAVKIQEVDEVRRLHADCLDV